MVFNINNFFDDRNKNSKIADFQDLDHIDGVSVSTVSANLYNQKRDDLVLFYFSIGFYLANNSFSACAAGSLSGGVSVGICPSQVTLT